MWLSGMAPSHSICFADRLPVSSPIRPGPAGRPLADSGNREPLMNPDARRLKQEGLSAFVCVHRRPIFTGPLLALLQAEVGQNLGRFLFLRQRLVAGFA